MAKIASLLWICIVLVLAPPFTRIVCGTDDEKEESNPVRIDQSCLLDKLSVILEECASTTIPDDSSADEADDDSTSSPTFASTTTSPTQQQRLCPLAKLELDLDRNRMMHRLAAKYFGFQNFWFLFIPSIGITSVSGILATVSDSGSLTNWISTDVRALSSTFVGILSILSVFFQSISKELDYGHRAKEHAAAAVGLRSLYDQIKFDQLSMQQQNNIVHTKTKATSTRNMAVIELVKRYEEKYRLVLEGCESTFPPAILNAYELASTRLELHIFPPFLDASDTRIDWIQTMGIVNNEVFNSFDQHFWWPLRLPNTEDVVEHAFQNLFRILSTYDEGTANHPQEEEQNIKYIPADGAAVGHVYRLLSEKQQQLAKTSQKFQDEDNNCACSQCQNDCPLKDETSLES